MKLKKKYLEKVLPDLKSSLSYRSVMAVPKIEKITVNMGVGEAAQDKKILANAMSDLAKMTGQKPLQTVCKKSIASFKVREGWPIGCKVTLRKDRMYDFLEKIISVVLPRVRDFRGLSTRSFDGRGNYSFGLKEQTYFPEIDYDQVDAVRGLDITITTSAKSNKEAFLLLKNLGFPFREKEMSN